MACHVAVLQRQAGLVHGRQDQTGQVVALPHLGQPREGMDRHRSGRGAGRHRTGHGPHRRAASSAPRSSAGVPQEVVARVAGTAPATSARRASGTS